MSEKYLGLDLRLPMGAMFVLLALVLVVYGWLQPGAEAPLTHVNVNRSEERRVGKECRL